jgi:hypothetical protein
MAAPRKYPIELKERAIRLWRSEQPGVIRYAQVLGKTSYTVVPQPTTVDRLCNLRSGSGATSPWRDSVTKLGYRFEADSFGLASMNLGVTLYPDCASYAAQVSRTTFLRSSSSSSSVKPTQT